MNLNPKTELAVKVIEYLKQHPGAASKEIAGVIGDSEYKVRRVCKPMVDKGLLEVRAGSRGGYGVKTQITVFELLGLFDPGSFSHPEFDQTNHPEAGLYLAKCDIIVALYNVFI